MASKAGNLENRDMNENSFISLCKPKQKPRITSAMIDQVLVSKKKQFWGYSVISTNYATKDTLQTIKKLEIWKIGTNAKYDFDTTRSSNLGKK